jgi:DNA-binding response OmpR family regulator
MKKKKILVIEDELSLRHVLRDKFTREGFEVIEAKNGEEGLGASLSERPDLILLDIIMPVMDGMMMLKKLREDAWGKGAKVIILTNLNDNIKVAEAMAEGSYNFLVKTDWKIEDVVKTVKEKLKT